MISARIAPSDAPAKKNTYFLFCLYVRACIYRIRGSTFDKIKLRRELVEMNLSDSSGVGVG